MTKTLTDSPAVPVAAPKQEASTKQEVSEKSTQQETSRKPETSVKPPQQEALPTPASSKISWDFWDVYDMARPRKDKASTRPTREDVAVIIALHDAEKVFLENGDLRVYHDLVPEVIAALQATAPSKAKAK